MTYQLFPVKGPFKGFDNSLPKPHTDPSAFDDIVNFLCRKGRLHTRPRVNSYSTPPDAAIVRKVISFQDIQGSWHTVVLTTAHAYMLTAGPTWNLLTMPGGITDLTGTSLPYGIVNTQGRLYFSNGSCKLIYSDGESSLKAAGDVPGAMRFLASNTSRVIGAYTTEPAPGAAGSREYPYRVIWSKSGDPTNWTDFTAGYNDLIDVPDSGITGMATLGRNTFIYRPNGITVMAPTGVSNSPFSFEDVETSEEGIGNQYPYAHAVYGDNSIIIGKSDIYIHSPTGLQPIGGAAKASIFNNLLSAAGDSVSGAIISRFGVGLDYLSYWLSIPGVNITWVYHWDENSWTKFSSSVGRVTSLGEVLVP